jgi:hypothetical protein
LAVNQARSPSYKYYLGKVFTYKLDQTIVTVGAPSMLAMSTSSASAGTSSSAWAATGSPGPVIVLGSGLLSSVGTCGSTTLSSVVSSATQALLRWGLDCGSFRSARPPCPSHLPSLDQWGRTMESPATTQNSIVSIQTFQDKYSTTLLEGLTSWDVVSVTFNFLATRLDATLRGLLGGAGRLASRLVSGSSMRGCGVA